MKTDNVLAKMQEITEKSVKLYKCDFYDFDVPRIKDENPSEFVWMVRETGTHIMTPRLCDEDKVAWRNRYELLASINKDFYYCTMNPDGSGTVTKSPKRCEEFAARQTR